MAVEGNKVVPRNPNRLHDRQVFYKYATVSTAKVILAARTLRWSSPLIFNDPFDMPRKLTFDCTNRELQEALAEALAQLIERAAAPPPNANELLKVLLDLLQRNPNPELRAAIAKDLRDNALKTIPEPAVGLRAFQDHWDEIMPTMRVLCVSETADSTPMWAHYADSHRGVVLEFEASDGLDSALLIARSVRYQDEPPKLPSKEEWVESLIGRKKIDVKEFFADYQFVKSNQWAYEKEWRVVSYARPGEAGQFGDYAFTAGELRRVILGAKCTVEDENAIRVLVIEKYPSATVVRARFNQEFRRIDI